MSPEGSAFLRTVFAQLRQPAGCVRLWQIFRTIRIRDSKDSHSRIYSCVATGVNEHPCAVTPQGRVHAPLLPVYKQVLRISNALCIHICRRRTSSQTAVELCKDSFSFISQVASFRNCLFCDSNLSGATGACRCPIELREKASGIA